MTKSALLLASALLLSGCPETLGQQCPSSSAPIGQYTLTFANSAPANECRVTRLADGGAPPPDASIAQSAPSQTATLCVGPADGGLALTLAVPGKASRTSDLADGGGFSFGGHTDPSGDTTLCGCPLGVDETFSGVLLVPADAGFELLADGGVPLVTGLAGTLTDAISTTTGSACNCNVPCSLQYSVNGTRL